MRILSYTGPPGDRCLTLQTGNFYFGTSGYYSSGTDIFLQILAALDLSTAHTAIQLAPPVITLVANSKAPASLLRTYASTDLDFDRSQ